MQLLIVPVLVSVALLPPSTPSAISRNATSGIVTASIPTPTPMSNSALEDRPPEVFVGLEFDLAVDWAGAVSTVPVYYFGVYVDCVAKAVVVNAGVAIDGGSQAKPNVAC